MRRKGTTVRPGRENKRKTLKLISGGNTSEWGQKTEAWEREHRMQGPGSSCVEGMDSASGVEGVDSEEQG